MHFPNDIFSIANSIFVYLFDEMVPKISDPIPRLFVFLLLSSRGYLFIFDNRFLSDMTFENMNPSL